MFFLKMGDLARGCSDGDGPGGEESQSLWPRMEADGRAGGTVQGFLSLSTPGILNRWLFAVWGVSGSVLCI